MNARPLQEKDIAQAANVLTLAFENDPIFRYIFQDEKRYRRVAPWLFGTWVRWTLMYGAGWMSENGDAVVLMRSLKHSRMSLWTMIRAGMLPTPRKLGWAAFRRFYFNVVATLDRKHAEVMGSRPHWYGWMIGATEPGRGSGSALLRHCFAVADENRLPIFLETATANNVALYNAKDFEVADSVCVSENCRIYFMVREPQGKSSGQ